MLEKNKPPNVLGIELKRKLTRKESKSITKEVMDLNLRHWEDRVSIAFIKALGVINGG